MNRNNQTPFWRFCIWCGIQICKAKLTSNAREIDQSMGKLSWGASWLLPNPSAKGNGIMASWVFCCNCQLRLVAFFGGCSIVRGLALRVSYALDWDKFTMSWLNPSAAGNYQRFKDGEGLVPYILLVVLHSQPVHMSLRWFQNTEHCAKYVPCQKRVGETCETHKTYGKTERTLLNFWLLGFCLHLLGPESLWAEIIWAAFLSWTQENRSGNSSRYDMLCRQRRLCRGWHRLVFACFSLYRVGFA